MLDEWDSSPWKPARAEGLTFDPLVATILLTTGAYWMQREGKEMAVRVAFISLQFKPRYVLSRNKTPILTQSKTNKQTNVILIIDSARLLVLQGRT